MSRFNKVCARSDWTRVDISNAMREDLHQIDNCLQDHQRKHWEWAMGFSALRHFGFWDKDKMALGLGAGHEAFMYGLADHTKAVIATDLYGVGDFSGGEADSRVLQDPSAFARFPYRRENLLVMKMDATDIVFGNDHFDILFSFSSMEHFGPTARIEHAMKEARRVLKPGGIYVTSVDFIVHPADPPGERDSRPGLAGAAFSRRDVIDTIVGAAGFRLAEPIDFDVDGSSISNVYDLTTGESTGSEWFPHIYLGDRVGEQNYVFSSLFLALFA